MLPSPTIRKFFRETFTETNPIRLTNPASQRELLTPWQKEFDRLDRVECKFRVIHRLKLSEQINQLDITVSPNTGGENWGKSERYVLFFSDDDYEKNGFLLLKDDSWKRSGLNEAKISSGTELLSFIEKVKARQDRNALRDRKADKISTLKESGMKAKLRELGAEHNFGFAMGSNARNVNLSLQVAGRKTGFHFSFPKGKFDQMIEDLPKLIENFETMAKIGITFRTNNRKWQLGEWIFPSTDDDDE